MTTLIEQTIDELNKFGRISAWQEMGRYYPALDNTPEVELKFHVRLPVDGANPKSTRAFCRVAFSGAFDETFMSRFETAEEATTWLLSQVKDEFKHMSWAASTEII